MKIKSSLVLFSSLMLAIVLVESGCQQPDSSSVAATGAAGTSGSTSTTTTTTSSSSSTINALQVITKADPTGSFDGAAVPASGGALVKAARIFNLDGSLIQTGNLPTWFVESRLFLTSTRTTAGAVTNVTSNTPCAYFDTFTTDNNPDTSGFYTVDGYFINGGGTDVDQCAGTAAAELNQITGYVQVDRRFMSSSDKLQIIIKARALDTPNTAPTASTCNVAGFFDPAACTNQLYTVTMRTAVAAAAKPFYILFPSAKSLDLLSESVILPINIDTSLTTISIDRVKGGAIFYGISVIRLQ